MKQPFSSLNSLLDLDPHQSVRAELRGAGVVERRIFALYPPEFSELLPGLTLRIGQAKPEELIRLSREENRAEAILYAGERSRDSGGGRISPIHPQHTAAYAQAKRSTVTLDELRRILVACFHRHSQKFSQSASLAALTSTKVLWCAHRFQAYRHELHPEYAAEADALDARVCAILNASR